MKKQSNWMWLVAGALMAIGALWAWPYVRPAFRGGVQAATAWLSGTGSWGPPLVVTLQFLQAVVSPLPSWPVTVAAGALYGPLPGTGLSLLGGSLGAAFNFAIARRLGKPFVHRTLGEGWVERAGRLGPLHYLLLSLFGRLIPIASFDMVAYLAGVGTISLPIFLLVAAVGQAPALFAYAYFGSDLASANQAGLLGSLAVVLFVGLLVGGRRLWQYLLRS